MAGKITIKSEDGVITECEITLNTVVPGSTMPAIAMRTVGPMVIPNSGKHEIESELVPFDIEKAVEGVFLHEETVDVAGIIECIIGIDKDTKT